LLQSLADPDRLVVADAPVVDGVENAQLSVAVLYLYREVTLSIGGRHLPHITGVSRSPSSAGSSRRPSSGQYSVRAAIRPPTFAAASFTRWNCPDQTRDITVAPFLRVDNRLQVCHALLRL